MGVIDSNRRGRGLALGLALGAVGVLAIVGSVAISRVAPARRAAEALTAHAPPDARKIVVTSALLAALRREFAAQNGHPPTPEQEAALVRDHVDREVLYREAQALDLGREDPIVKRRLVQKMEALLDTAVPTEPPTDAQVSEWFWAHRGEFERPARVSLTHVFFRREKIDGDLEHVAQGAIEALEGGAALDSMGDPFVRGRSFVSRSRDELATIFGAEFADRVMTLPEKRWSGPIPSSYGWHLVRIDGREGAHLPEIAEVRGTIEGRLTKERRERDRREALDRLRSQYQIETPAP